MTTLRAWCKGIVTPELRSLLNICWSSGLTLSDLLTGRGLGDILSLKDENFLLKLKPIRKRKQFDCDRVL
jgi:hypothetical protein